MRAKLLSLVAGAAFLVTSATAANPNYGTYGSDGYLFGFSNNNTEGYITCEWTGYASPYTPAVPGFRLVIWSGANGYLAPIHSETFGAYGSSTNYFKQVFVPRGYPTTVEVYATGNQYNNSPNLNWCYVTYSWIHNQ